MQISYKEVNDFKSNESFWKCHKELMSKKEKLTTKKKKKRKILKG